MTQMTFDRLMRGQDPRGECRFLVRDQFSGMVVEEGLVILGRCGLMSGTAYDRRCEMCGSWEART